MVEPVILELAVNGATPRHRNRHVPRTPAEITEAALAGIESGASIVHNHNDEPMFTADGVHAVEPYLAAWRPVLERHPDALLYPTMAAGARGIPVARRWDCSPDWRMPRIPVGRFFAVLLAPRGGLALFAPAAGAG